MKLSCLLTFLLIGLFFSCKEAEVKKKEPRAIDIWYELELKVRDQKIIIYNDADTATLVNYRYKLISKEAFMGTYELEKVEHSTITLEKNERDSLFTYAQSVVKNAVQTNIFCTDYVGNIDLILSNKNSYITYKYRSVCDWSEVSPELMKIYTLLSKKAEISTN